MSFLRLIYLVLAIVGTVYPMTFYVPWVQENGLDLQSLTAAWQGNLAATGLYWDLLISAIALSIWIIAETYARKDYWVLICVPATFLIGVSCGLPLFLFLRTRPIA